MSQKPHNLPQPGQVVHTDFREQRQKHTPAPDDRKPQKPLRLVQFNIERGYQLPLIIQQLQELDADVISLQEVGGNANNTLLVATLAVSLLKRAAVACFFCLCLHTHTPSSSAIIWCVCTPKQCLLYNNTQLAG